ncbi:MAG: type II secretion system major pseudopilin GspG [Pseudomonadota bacterium]
MRQRKIRLGGFTLIEIMAVLVILGILATYVGVKIVGHIGGARKQQASLQINTLATALKMYKLDNSVYPSTEQSLKALVEAPTVGKLPKRWREGGYLEGKVPLDPWDNEYIYLSPGSHGDFDISSLGADGQEGGEGEDADITNWESEEK